MTIKKTFHITPDELNSIIKAQLEQKGYTIKNIEYCITYNEDYWGHEEPRYLKEVLVEVEDEERLV